MTDTHCMPDLAVAGRGAIAWRPGAPINIRRRRPAADPTRVYEKLIKADHCLAGGRRILETLERIGPACVRRLALAVYPDLDPCLHLDGAQCVLARLVVLIGEGRVLCGGLPTLGAVYRAARRPSRSGDQTAHHPSMN
ncbi:MAG: hypothetical protein H0X27_08770 [Caulobacteraceae bacterium]|nr:hypothetical protein [Caulobacteraceae bacterium]